MIKVFNKYMLNDVKDKIKEYTGFGIETNDLKKGKAFKQIRDTFLNIKYADSLFNILTNDEKKKMLSVFFPIKFSEISQGEYETKRFLYHSGDNKIHWLVVHNGNERHLKLKTDNYSPRVKDFVDRIMKDVKKIIDPIYGYWLIEENRYWYITDGNKTNGEYRVLADMAGKILRCSFTEKYSPTMIERI